MKILFLGYPHSRLIPWLREEGYEVVQTQDPISGDGKEHQGFDWVISFGYRHILKKNFLERFPDRVVNLHISLLPWNRGVDPVFWSYIEGTPRGITLHYISPGVDTGDIIAQKKMDFSENATLGQVNKNLKSAIEDYFIEYWPMILAGTTPRKPQEGIGSFHRHRDRVPLNHLLTQDMDTPVKNLVAYGKKHGLRKFNPPPGIRFGAWLLGGLETLDRRLTRVAMHLMKWRTGANQPVHPKNLLRVRNPESLWFQSFLQGRTGGEALDLGAGSGAVSMALARAGFSVTSLELDEKNIRQIESFRIQEKAGQKITVIRHNLEEGPYPLASNQYDVAVSCDVVEHLYARQLHLREAARALKLGGLLFVAAPNRCTTWKKIRGFFGLPTTADDDHKIEYSREEFLKEMANAGFTKIIFESPTVVDAPINGLIELMAPLSLSLYSFLLHCKKIVLHWFPGESSGFRMVFVKTEATA